MRTILEFDDVTFYQDEDNRVTVAVVDGCSLDAYMDFLAEINAPIQDENSLSAEELLSIPEQFMMPSTIKAKSTCHTNDQWDPEVGKRQAFFKLSRTYNKMKRRVYKRMIAHSENQVKVFNKMIIKCESRITHYNELVCNRKGDFNAE